MIKLTQVAFICFKVLGLIDWSWWAVFTPLYIAVGLATLLALLGYIIADDKLTHKLLKE